MTFEHLDGVPIISEHNQEELCGRRGAFQGYGRGYIPRDYARNPTGSFGFAKPMADPNIPRYEWKERTADIHRMGSVSSIALRRGVRTKSQGRTNYCWAFACVLGMEVNRAIAGEDYVSLSPASVAAKITNFQNVGGYAIRAIKHIATRGVVPSSQWPDIAIDRRYDNLESQSVRQQHRLQDWLDLPPRNFDAMFTQLLLRRPVCAGYDWWGHEVLLIDPLVLPDGRFAVKVWNSWGAQWGQGGFGILPEGKGTPSDAISPIVATAV